MAQPIWNASTKSYSYLEKDNPKDRVEVIVGDDQDSTTLFPQVKIKRWDEVSASIRLIHDTIPGNITYSDDGTKITWIKKQGKNEWKAVFYHRDDLDEGGFEFEIHLPAKPPVNYLEFTVNTKELDWFYQGALTQQDIDRGAQRPENVVGSYAVYHKNKGGINDVVGMEYKAGKAFHVYRPHVVDANGNETWGTLSLNETTGILTIAVDRTWLNNAVYPVIVDPTFGYTSVGASTTVGGSSGVYEGSRFTSPSNAATLNSVSIYCRYSSSAGNLKGMMVLDSNKNIISGGVGGAVAMPATIGWTTSTYASPPNLSASTAYIIGEIPNNTIFYAYDDNVGYQWWDESNNYTTPTNPTDGAVDDWRMSIYATYTASGGTETATPSPVTTALSVVAPTASYAQVNSRTPNPVTITLSPVTPTRSYVQVETNTPNSLSVTSSIVTPTSSYLQAGTASHSSVGLTLTPVTPTASYIQINTATHNPVVTTLSAITPVRSYIQVESNTPDPVGINVSVVSPSTGYVSGGDVFPTPVSLNITVIAPSTTYVQIASTTPNPVQIGLAPVAPSTSYIQIGTDAPDSVSSTLSVVTPSAGYIAVVSTTPNPVSITLSPAIPLSSYAQINSTTPDAINLTASVITPVSEYDSDIEIVATTPDPILLTLTTPAVNRYGLVDDFPSRFIYVDGEMAMRLSGKQYMML